MRNTKILCFSLTSNSSLLFLSTSTSKSLLFLFRVQILSSAKATCQNIPRTFWYFHCPLCMANHTHAFSTTTRINYSVGTLKKKKSLCRKSTAHLKVSYSEMTSIYLTVISARAGEEGDLFGPQHTNSGATFCRFRNSECSAGSAHLLLQNGSTGGQIDDGNLLLMCKI